MKTDETNHCRECGKPVPVANGGQCLDCLVRFSFGVSSEPHPATSPDGEASGVVPEPVAATMAVQDRSEPQGRLFAGDYELLMEIGRGGMGIVFRARQRSLNRFVALKMIPFGALATEEAVARFRAEAEAAAHLQHPNIIAIYEISECEGQHFFSMEYVEGGTLADLLREGPLPARRAAKYLQTIAQAVHYAHERGILHRDLKPSNILIDPHDQPRVTDFGLAKRMSGDPAFTITAQALGSPNYMPPEQASARKTDMGPRSDLYSLGAMLYHALTGRPPFQAESVDLVLFRVATEEPVSPRLLNSSVPRDLETICLKCLSKEPARRYATAREFADELGRFLRDEPILAKPTARVETVWRWCRRKPALAGSLALLFLVFMAGAGGILWQWRRAETNAATLRQNAYAAEMELAFRSQAAGDLNGARRRLERYTPAYHTLQANAISATIGGGHFNAVGSEARFSTIAGGDHNAIQTRAVADSFIGGGANNTIWTGATNATIAGGRFNHLQTSAHFAAIGGGNLNGILPQAFFSTIGGGNQNIIEAGAADSTIGGGNRNVIQANACYATIPGGVSNTVAGNFAFAAGYHAHATSLGAFVWSDGTGTPTHSDAANSVTFRASGGYKLLTDTESAGVSLAPGSGSWTTLSDRQAKAHFAPVDTRVVLEKLAALPVNTWNYKSQPESVRHIGPTAQDFKAAFAVGESDTGISSVDADGVALAAIQGLNEVVKQKETRIAELEKRVAEIERLISKLAHKEDRFKAP